MTIHIPKVDWYRGRHTDFRCACGSDGFTRLLCMRGQRMECVSCYRHWWHAYYEGIGSAVKPFEDGDPSTSGVICKKCVAYTIRKDDLTCVTCGRQEVLVQ